MHSYVSGSSAKLLLSINRIKTGDIYFSVNIAGISEAIEVIFVLPFSFIKLHLQFTPAGRHYQKD